MGKPGSGAEAEQRRELQRYLRALLGHEPRDGLLEVRYRRGNGMRHTFFSVTQTLTAARSILRLGLSSDVYVGVAPRRQPTGGKTSIERVWVLWADVDHPDARRALEELPVAPAIVIASGTPGHLHAYWPLTSPLSVPSAETANRRLAAQLHADSGAVTNAATILRPPGTYSWKSTPPTPVILERLTQARSTLPAVMAGIAQDPAPPARDVRASLIEHPGQDPLRALAPALYVGVLTGQEVGRSRKVQCPFHEDRTPSLHAYEAPEDGWYCFGCQRVGHSVYDLASAMWDLDTRGPSFVELRSRLYEIFLPGQPPPPRPPRRAQRPPADV